MRIKILLLLLLIYSPALLVAEETAESKPSVYQGFSGGMMLHSGYLFGVNQAAPADASGKSYSLQGAPIGIGGALRVHLWQLLRVGFEGSVSTLHSGMTNQRDRLQTGSYSRIGCGGINADACWRNDKVWPYIGAALGGGSIRSLYIIDGDQADWLPEKETFVNKQSFFYVTPYVGIDYCATRKLHLTFRFDWMLAIRQSRLIMPTGPRLYVGLMFTH